MSKEPKSSTSADQAGQRVLSAVLVVMGTALCGSAALMISHLNRRGVVVFAAFAVATLTGGLVLARRSGLFVGWAWSGRPWSEVLTPGGPVRSPFEWIRVGVAASAGAVLVLLVAVALFAGIAWRNDQRFAQPLVVHDATFGQGILGAVGVLGVLVGLAGLLLGIFAVGSLVIGVIGAGLRSGATSMSLRDWVSMDKRT